MEPVSTLFSLLASSSMGALDIAGMSAGTALAGTGAAVGAIGALSSAGSQAAAAESATNAANYNATMARQNATSALQKANADEETQRRQSAKQLGAQRASLAENGISLTEGTGTDLTGEAATNAALDALNIRYGGQLRARGYTNEAALYTAQAQDAMRNKKTALRSGYLSAGASLLSSYGNYTKMGARTGVTG